jgi:hypothetical protein
MTGDARTKSNKRVTILGPSADHVTTRQLQIPDADEMPVRFC